MFQDIYSTVEDMITGKDILEIKLTCDEATNDNMNVNPDDTCGNDICDVRRLFIAFSTLNEISFLIFRNSKSYSGVA